MKLRLALAVMLLALLSLGTWGTPIMVPNATADLDPVKGPSRNSVLSDGDIVQMMIPVLEEEAVANSSPDMNFHGNIIDGGLFVGMEPVEPNVARS